MCNYTEVIKIHNLLSYLLEIYGNRLIPTHIHTIKLTCKLNLKIYLTHLVNKYLIN
jgi:hypothetical protein